MFQPTYTLELFGVVNIPNEVLPVYNVIAL